MIFTFFLCGLLLFGLGAHVFHSSQSLIETAGNWAKRDRYWYTDVISLISSGVVFVILSEAVRRLSLPILLKIVTGTDATRSIRKELEDLLQDEQPIRDAETTQIRDSQMTLNEISDERGSSIIGTFAGLSVGLVILLGGFAIGLKEYHKQGFPSGHSVMQAQAGIFWFLVGARSMLRLIYLARKVVVRNSPIVTGSEVLAQCFIPGEKPPKALAIAVIGEKKEHFDSEYDASGKMHVKKKTERLHFELLCEDRNPKILNSLTCSFQLPHDQPPSCSNELRQIVWRLCVECKPPGLLHSLFLNWNIIAEFELPVQSADSSSTALSAIRVSMG